MMISSLILLIGLIANYGGALQSGKERSDLNDRLCGAECIYVVLSTQWKISEPFHEFQRKLLPPESIGYSLDYLKSVADSYGCTTQYVPLEDLRSNGVPDNCCVIVHQKPAHFQIIRKVDKDVFWFVDTKLGQAIMAFPEVKLQYSNVCLLIAANPGDMAKSSNFASWFLVGFGILLGAVFVILLRKKLFSCFVVLILAGLAGCDRKVTGPELVCRQKSIHADDVEINKPLSFQFELMNHGDQPVLIDQINTSCSCASATMRTTKIAPRSKEILTATVTPSQNGSTEATIRLSSNDSRQPIMELRAYWTLASEVQFSIPRITCTLSNASDTEEVVFRVRGNSNGTIQLYCTEDEPDSPVGIHLSHVADRDWLIKFFVKAEVPGIYSGRVAARVANDEGDDLGEIPWVVKVEPNIQVHPASIWLGNKNKRSDIVELLVEKYIDGEIRVFDDKRNEILIEQVPLDSSTMLVRIDASVLEFLPLIDVVIGRESLQVPIERSLESKN
jgi:hypothetical protein